MKDDSYYEMVGWGVLLLIILICGASMAYGTSEHVTANVIRTESVMKRDDHKYLVYTDLETFENSDTLFYLKYNSSDIYGQIKPGMYKFKVYGFRLPFFSMYRNIVSIEKITER